MQPSRRGFWCVLAALGVAPEALAQTSFSFDAEGDVSKKTEPWFDVTMMEVGREDGRAVTRMQVAAALPEAPPGLPGSSGWSVWETAAFDTDPTTAPEGWPFNKHDAFSPEFMLLLIADGEDYFALFADRRPLLRGEEVILLDSRDSEEVEWSETDGLIEISVPWDLLDDPPSFGWRGGVVWFNSDLSQSTHVLDFGVNPPYSWVAWPPAD